MGNMLRHGVDMYKRTMDGDFNKLDEGFLKTGKEPAVVKPEIARPESKYRRVAKFLILIGSEQASEILAKLDPGQVAEISREISQVKFITPEEGKEIFAEFLTAPL
jgi:hypothetical protein